MPRLQRIEGSEQVAYGMRIRAGVKLLAEMVVAEAPRDIGEQMQMGAVGPLGNEQNDDVAHRLSVRRIERDGRSRPNIRRLGVAQKLKMAVRHRHALA